jgi:hypothetical protein
LLLWALLAGCTTKDPDSGYSVVVRDGGYGEVPTREVVNEFPDGSVPVDGSAPVIGGGISGGGQGGEAGQSGQGGSGGAPSPPDAAADALVAACSVIAQDCGPGKGCYPQGGRGVCSVAGDLGQHTPCGEHQQCAPGLLCVDAFGAGGRLCEPACDINRNDACTKGDLCRLYVGSVGVCVPQ